MATPRPDAKAVPAAAADPVAEKELLRLVVCGSVGDGAATLIGRLLGDGGSSPGDRSVPLEDKQVAAGEAARGVFRTGRRNFAVTEATGGTSSASDVATVASKSDLAVIMVDARHGMLEETRRHATVAHLMGIRDIVVAVNKMDLIGRSERRFRRIELDVATLADHLGSDRVTVIPVSALDGDNLFKRSAAMGWYRGPTLVEYLETVEATCVAAEALRFPVQWVNRPDPDSRGYSGTVRGGAVSVGDQVRVFPSRAEASVARIVTDDGDVVRAETGDAVTLVLDREVEAARGDLIAAADDTTVAVADQLQATLVWVGEAPLLPGRRYAARIGTAVTGAHVTTIKHRLDLETHAHESARTLRCNDIGVVTLALDRALPFDGYAANPDTGSLVLIDLDSDTTVAAGTIEYALRRATNVVWHDTAIDKGVRAGLKGQQPACVWFTGLSGSGKSTVANLLDQRLTADGRHTYILDGDNVRHGLNQDLGFTEADRVENIRRIAEVAKLMVDAGLIVMVCAISPYKRDREMAREIFDDGEFVEVFVDTPLAVCETRDPKGLYAKARDGLIPNFTGISSPYEPPEAPEVRLDGERAAEDLADAVLARLERPAEG